MRTKPLGRTARSTRGLASLIPILLGCLVTGPARAELDPIDAQVILQIEARRLPPRALAPYIEHEDAQTRARAARGLGRLRDTAALAGLRPLTSDDDAQVRFEAAFALGQTPGGAPAAAQRLAEEPDPMVRARLIEALGKQGDAAVVPLLRTALRTPGGLRPSPEVPAAAIALGRLAMKDVAEARSPDVLGELLATLHRLDKPARRAAAFALARSKATTLAGSDRAALLDAAATDWDPAVRALLVRAASGLELTDAERDALLADAAADLEPAVRIAAARASVKLGWEPVAELLDDPDRGVRREAIAAVGAIESLSPGPLLRPIVKAGANLEAAEALRTSGDSRLIEAAAAMRALAARGRLSEPQRYLSTDRPTRIRAAAVEGLSDPERLLALATDDGEALVRTAAAVRLSEVVTDPGQMLPLLEAFDPIVASVAAEHLTNHPVAGTEGPLASAFLDTDDPDLLRATAAALSARYQGHPNPPLGRDDAVAETLDRLASHPDAGVRAAATELREVLHLPDAPVPHSLINVSLEELRQVQGARIQTSRGEVRIELLVDEAPLTVANFTWLADQGFYNRLQIHRVVPDFVVQDGDPRGDGYGGPGWSIPDEINPVPYDTGVVGMALAGPDTGGSQWFVTLSPQPHLDGGYTVFGRVTAGMPVLESLQPGDFIEHIRIERSRVAPDALSKQASN